MPLQPQPLPEKALTKGVSLTPSLWRLAQNIATGNASKGIQIALRFYVKHNEVKENPNG